MQLQKLLLVDDGRILLAAFLVVYCIELALWVLVVVEAVADVVAVELVKELVRVLL